MASQQLWKIKLETVHNLTEVGKDEDENMDDDAQELDTTHMSTEKQPALTSTEGAPRGLSLGARQALATQLEKDILAEEIEIAALKRSLHLQKHGACAEVILQQFQLSPPRKNQCELDDFLLQCWNTFTMRLNTYESDEYQVMWGVTYLQGQVVWITWQLKNQSVMDFFNYLDKMLSHVNQFTDEQLMEWALSGLWLEICMVIEQMLSQPMSYTELVAITHQIEQSQREVQRKSTLQAGLPQNPSGTCPVVATAVGAAVSTVTTRADSSGPASGSQRNRGGCGRERGDCGGCGSCGQMDGPQKCFICDSPDHLKWDCPQQTESNEAPKGDA
ncbi:MAG: hypothetical protein M1815_000956 [Lichina confinis]|nr:MAG: hypothetical protein M1815_000956 [Lichina confinis]